MKITDEIWARAWQAFDSPWRSRLDSTLEDRLRAAIEAIEPEPEKGPGEFDRDQTLLTAMGQIAKIEARLHLIRCNQVEERGRAVEASERLSKRLDALEARVVSIEEKDRAAEWRVPDSCQQMQLNTLQDRITDLEASLETRLQAYERAALTVAQVYDLIDQRLTAYQDGIDRVARATDTERVREIVRALLSEDPQPGNATHAVAAAWASMDGVKLDPEGGYLEEAEEMIKRMEKRGYRVVRDHLRKAQP